MKRARALPGILFSVAALTACGGKPETPAPPVSGSAPAVATPVPGYAPAREAPPSEAPPSAPAASDPATPAAGSPDPAAAAAARAAAEQERAKLFAEVGKFTLTNEHIDKIGRVDTALAEFWANPAEKARIRASTHVDKILVEIEKTPVFVKALEKEKLAARDYIMGTFAMLGGYSYIVVVAQNPEAAKQGPPPVNAATLEVVKKRLSDVERIVRPPSK